MRAAAEPSPARQRAVNPPNARESDARAAELAQLELSIGHFPITEPGVLLARLEAAHPYDVPFRVQAAGLLASSRYRDVRLIGFQAFERVLMVDTSQRRHILPYVRADLERHWLTMSNLDLIRSYYYDQLLPELVARLDSESDTLRQNAYLALRERDRSRRDLFEFHRRNLVNSRRYSPSDYAERVQTPLGWAISYFEGMTDSSQVREAIDLLRTLRSAPELGRASVLIDNALSALQPKVGTPP